MTAQPTQPESTLPVKWAEKMWKPGQSGNPGGKSKKLEEVKALAKDASRRALERIIELIESDDDRIALMAAKEVLDRAWGKPKEVDDDGPKGAVTINIIKYSDGNGNKTAEQLESPAVSIRAVEVPGERR